MSEMWDQEGLGCAGSRLRGDIKKELRAHRIAARAVLVVTPNHTARRSLRFATTFYRVVIGIVRCSHPKEAARKLRHIQEGRRVGRVNGY